MSPSKFAPLEAVVLPDLPPPRRPWPRWLLVCGSLLLAIGLVSAVLWGIGKLATTARSGSTGDADSLVDHWETPSERLKNIAEAMNAAEVGASPGELRAFERILSRVSAASREMDADAYQACFDLNALIRRITRHPAARTDRSLAMWTLKNDLQIGLEPAEGTSEMSIVRVERGRRPDQVLVYAVESSYYSVGAYRWWLVRSGRNWRVCDYERLDHGQSLAAGWALRGAIERDASKYNYHGLYDAIDGSSTPYPTGLNLPGQSGTSNLERYINLPMPAVVGDVPRLDLASALVDQRRAAAALAACDKIDRPDECPGVHLVRGRAWQVLGRPAKSLAAAADYQRAAGRDPQALAMEASAHETLDDFTAAAEKWADLFALCPQHPQALAHFCRLASDQQRRRLPELIARSKQPLEAASSQALSALQREDEDTYAALVKFIAERAPDSPMLESLAAHKLSHEEDYEAAAASFLKASQAEWLPEKKQEYFNQYLYAMTEAKKTVEAYQQATDPQAAFDYLTSGYEDDEGWIADDQLRLLLAAHRQKKGSSFRLDYLEGMLLLRAKKYAEADQKFAEAATQASEDYEREMSRDRRIEALVAQGQGLDAYEVFGTTSTAYQSIARQFQTRQEWDDLRELSLRHRRHLAGDAWLDYFEAVELQGRGRHLEALASLQRGELREAEILNYGQWMKTELALAGGDVLLAYNVSEDKNVAFNNLAVRLSGEEDWEQLKKLVQAHPADATSPEMLNWATVGPFELGQYDDVIGRLQPWPGFAATTNPDEIEILYERLVRSLLRLGRRDEARAAAERAAREHELEVPLVMVLLAEGQFAELQLKLADRRLLSLVQQRPLDRDLELRQLLHTSELAEFRKANAWPLPADYSEDFGHVALLVREPVTCDRSQLETHLTAAGIPTNAIRPILADPSDKRTSYIIDTEYGTLLVTFGEAAAAKESETTDDFYRPFIADAALARAVEEHRGLVIVDFTRSPLEPTSHRIAGQAARLARELRSDSTLAVTGDRGKGQAWLADASPETFRRLARGELLVHRPPPDVLRLPYSFIPALAAEDDESSKAAKTLNRQVRELAREFASGQAEPREVTIELSRGHARERLPIRVTAVRRAQYGQWEFIGEPTSTSALWPYLRPGLPLAVGRYQIEQIGPDASSEPSRPE